MAAIGGASRAFTTLKDLVDKQATGLRDLVIDGQTNMRAKFLQDKHSIATSIVNLFSREAGSDDTKPLKDANQDAEAGDAGPMLENPEEAEQGQQQSEMMNEEGLRRAKPEMKRSKAVQDLQAILDQDLSVLALADGQSAPCIVNPRIWWRHPMLRLLAVWSIIVLDFFIYGSDPVQDSYVLYGYFGVYEDMFYFMPESSWQRAVRWLLFVSFTIGSMALGKFVIHHKFLRDTLGLQMFSEDNGTILVNFMTWVILTWKVLPTVINLIESGTLHSPITEVSVGRYKDWGKVWQSMAAVADMVSIVMITDTVLQDRVIWPDFAPFVKRVWNDWANGWVRVVVAWVAFSISLPTIVYGLYADGHTNGVYNLEEKVLSTGTTQWMRVLIASLLTMIDITTCLQDWEFPSFNTPVNFKVIGSFSSELECACLSEGLKPISNVLTFIPEQFWSIFHFKMSGKWIAYLPAFGALGVDWWYMFRTIFTFDPKKQGEYASPSCELYVITNTTLLDEAYDAATGALNEAYKDLISWEARHGVDDVPIKSEFCNSFPWMSKIWLGLGLTAGVIFIAMIIRAEYYWDRYFIRNNDKEVQARVESILEESKELPPSNE